MGFFGSRYTAFSIFCLTFTVFISLATVVRADNVTLLEIPKSFVDSFPIDARSGADAAISDRRLHITIPAKGDVELEEISSKAQNFNIPIRTNGGELIKEIRVPVRHFTDYAGTYAIFAASESGLYGELTYQSEGGTKSASISPSLRVDATIQHRLVDSTSNPVPMCGVDDFNFLTQQRQTAASAELMPLTAAAVTSWRELKLIAVATSDFSGSRPEEELAAEFAALLSVVNYFYEPLLLHISLSALLVERAGTDPYEAAVAGRFGEDILERARSEKPSLAGIDHDVLGIFAASDGFRYTGGLILGQAYLGVVCATPENSVFFATKGGANMNSLPVVTAHEIGHNLSMVHDPTIYPDGRSIMFPTSYPDAFGFSPSSINEYESFTAPGSAGSSCLQAVSAPPPLTLTFSGDPVEIVELSEGTAWTGTYRVTPDLAGVTYGISDLPIGSSLGDGTIFYTPGFDIAADGKIVEQTLTVNASLGKLKATKTVILRIHDVNRAPEIVLPDPLPLPVQGKRFKLTIQALDPDLNSTVKLEFLSKKVLDSLKGKKQLALRRSSATFRWQVPKSARGRFTFRFRTTDQNGLAKITKVSLRVLPKTNSPVPAPTS